MRRKYPLGLLQPLTRDFISRWRLKKSYPHSSYIDISDCLEILFASKYFHHDTSFEGGLSFDHLLDLREMKIGYDGQELIEILVWYVEAYIKDKFITYGKIIERR